MNLDKHIVCPSCQAVNRVPASKLGDGPKCGKCHQDIAPAKPVEMDTAGLMRQVEKGSLPVLVDFWASWCGPCRMMAPAFEQAAKELHPNVRLVKLNTEENQDMAARMGIQSIPTMVLFEGGAEKARTSGAMQAGAIVEWAKSNL